MKKHVVNFAWMLLLLVAFNSCSEDNLIGSSIQPDSDLMTVYVDTIGVQSETIFIDSVFLRNSVAGLGEFTDPTYGDVRSDFMAQLYCPYNFKFPNDVSSIDSGFIHLYYSSWFGDSTEAHHINVWELDKQRLDATPSYNASQDPADFTTMSNLLASGTFAPADFLSTDSVKELTSYQREARIPLNLDICRRFLRDNFNSSTASNFATPNAFLDYFKGIYVTTDQGDGSIFYIDHAEMEMCFDTYLYSYSSDELLRDSLVVGGAYFPMTKEIRQVNRVAHKNLKRLVSVSPSDTINYVYAPGGMFTKVTIPESIFKNSTGELSGKTINSFKLQVSATQLTDDWKYAMDPPDAMLLIDVAKVDSFFQGFSVSDGLYSFVATFDSDNDNYVFDLSYYAQKMLRSKAGTDTIFEPFTELLLIPVTVVTNDDGDEIRTEHVITPSAVKIRGGNHSSDPMRLRVVYSKN
jgi:hypothetical protein